MDSAPSPPPSMSIWKKIGFGTGVVVTALLSFGALMALLITVGSWWNDKNLVSTLILLGVLAVTGGLFWLTWFLNTFIRKPPAPKPAYCQQCGVGTPMMKAGLHRHIGMIILMNHERVHAYLCKPCIRRKFWEYTPVTAIVGWWGIVSFLITPIVLVNNVVIYLLTFRKTEADTPGAGLPSPAPLTTRHP